MDPTSRLRLATRIHFALLRHFNEDVDVRSLLKEGADAREALWVCEASGNPELVTLARQFALACRAEARLRAERVRAGTQPASPQDTSWAQDTSGFGVSRPLIDPAEADGGPTATSGWPSPVSWLRRTIHRGAR